MQDDILSRFSDGIEKFNEKDFFECHDILEDVWFEIRGESRKFYQGLIHLAVGFYHIIERDNPKGALSQLGKGLDKLEPYEPHFQGIELEHLLKKIRVCISEIEKIKKGETRSFNEKLIPKIKFDKGEFKV